MANLYPLLLRSGRLNMTEYPTIQAALKAAKDAKRDLIVLVKGKSGKYLVRADGKAWWPV